MSTTSTFDPGRVLDDLRGLAELTGGRDTGGARRLCWTDEWVRARAFLRERLDALPVEVETDEAGNTWAYLRGERPETVVVGSHVDSVPNGGWLDGALGVMAALEVLRDTAARGTPPVTVALVDWADEEGARFGRSLFGSSAVCGTLDPDLVRDLKDADGRRLEDVVGEHGVGLDRAHEAGRPAGSDVRAYLELHIEQGPVLESEGASRPARCSARSAWSATGRRSWARRRRWARPRSARRRDAFLAAARTALELARDRAAQRGRLHGRAASTARRAW